jgi:hypothetical protein
MGKTLVRRVGAVEDRRFTDRAWKKPELRITEKPRTTRRQGVERSQRRPTRQGGADPRRLNDETGAQGKKREEKSRNGNREGLRDGRTRRRGRGEGGENEISPPLPRTEPHRGGGKTSLKEVEITNEKIFFSQEREESFSGRGCYFSFGCAYYLIFGWLLMWVSSLSCYF